MGWEQLLQIIKENRRLEEAEKMAPITSCPECAYIPLRENSKGEKLCPMCGWRGWKR